jgi:hypothetical protein
MNCPTIKVTYFPILLFLEKETMPLIKSSEERLEIIDQLIGGRTFKKDRKKLLNLKFR